MLGLWSHASGSRSAQTSGEDHFWFTLCLAIVLVIAFPAIATWLPDLMR